MRPCTNCGHPLTNNLVKCEKCHRSVPQTVGINTQVADADQSEDPIDAPAGVYWFILLAIGCAFLLPPLAGYFAGGMFGLFGGLCLSGVFLAFFDVPTLMSF